MNNSDFNICNILADMSATFCNDFTKKYVVVPMFYDKIESQ